MVDSGRAMTMRSRRVLLAGLAGTAVLSVGLFVGLDLIPEPRTPAQSGAIGGPFALLAGDGQKLSARDFRGKWLLIYFGYTHCPDICPTTLSNLADTLAELGPAAARVQVLFVTLDPERDTPKVLLDYTAAFDSWIIGLT